MKRTDKARFQESKLLFAALLIAGLFPDFDEFILSPMKFTIESIVEGLSNARSISLFENKN